MTMYYLILYSKIYGNNVNHSQKYGGMDLDLHLKSVWSLP